MDKESAEKDLDDLRLLHPQENLTELTQDRSVLEEEVQTNAALIDSCTGSDGATDDDDVCVISEELYQPSHRK